MSRPHRQQSSVVGMFYASFLRRNLISVRKKEEVVEEEEEEEEEEGKQ